MSTMEKKNNHTIIKWRYECVWSLLNLIIGFNKNKNGFICFVNVKSLQREKKLKAYRLQANNNGDGFVKL